MALNITRGDEPLAVDHINLLIYAPPGVGKSSLAFTASEPLMLDFDGGAHRSGFRRDTVRVQTWQEVAAIDPADLKQYNTVIIDTVGRALDMLTTSLQEDNPKLRTRHGGLTLPGYGELKASFASWLKSMRTHGKDIVMVAHEKEEKRGGDETVYRADVQGGSYAEIFKLADGVGYLHMGDKGQRILDFSPTDAHSGKNPANLAPFAYDLMAQPDCLAEIIDSTKSAVGAIGERSKLVAAGVQKWRETITAALTLDAVNEMVGLTQAEEQRSVQVQAKRLLMQHAKALGMTYDKDAGQFVQPEAPKDDALPGRDDLADTSEIEG